jgi:hypothetical protein
VSSSNPIVAELEEHLARIHREAMEDLRRERRALYLLALEREDLQPSAKAAMTCKGASAA